MLNENHDYPIARIQADYETQVIEINGQGYGDLIPSPDLSITPNC